MPPTYEYACQCGKTFDRILPVARYDEVQACVCGRPATKRVCAPAFFMPQDINYTSPIDGRPITSMQARIEDLKRSSCVPWEPGIAQDGERRKSEQEAAFDKAVDETVETEFAKMSPRQVEKLTNELVGGADINVERITPQQQSFRSTP